MQSIMDMVLRVTNYAAELLFNALDVSGMTVRRAPACVYRRHRTSPCRRATCTAAPQLWFDTGGGHGYGVVVGQWGCGTACLIEDNSFYSIMP